MLNLGFLASNAGSSMRGILDAIDRGDLTAQARLAVSNKASSPALEAAKGRGVATLCIPTVSDPDAADERLAAAMQGAGVELIVLSGYLRRLGPRTLGAYEGRILNIHPGPLPRFGGPGMYGRTVHEAVLAADAGESGVCVHVVDGEYDHGPVIARKVVPVLPGDTVEALEARVTAAEPPFFVETLRAIADGRLLLPSGALPSAAAGAKGRA